MLKDFKSPDLKKKRVKKSTKFVCDRDFAKKMIKQHSELSGYSESRIKEIVASCNGVLWETVLNNREGVMLPYFSGHVYIAALPGPKKRQNIDFKKSMQYGKVITHRNYDTDGKIAKIVFSNYCVRNRFKNRLLWAFKGVRDFQRQTAVVFRENFGMYVDKHMKVGVVSQFAEIDKIKILTYPKTE